MNNKGDKIFNRIYILLKETNGAKTSEIIRLQKELASLKGLNPSEDTNIPDQIVLNTYK